MRPHLLLVALLASPAAAEQVGYFHFQPSFSAARGLVLSVQNYSKLPRTIAGVTVTIGGDGRTGGCRVDLPGVELAAVETTQVVIADPRAVATCLGPTAARGLGRDLPRLARETVAPAAAPATAPVIRIEPRVAGRAAVLPIVFRLAAPSLVDNGRPAPVIRR